MIEIGDKIADLLIGSFITVTSRRVSEGIDILSTTDSERIGQLQWPIGFAPYCQSIQKEGDERIKELLSQHPDISLNDVKLQLLKFREYGLVHWERQQEIVKSMQEAISEGMALEQQGIDNILGLE